MFHGTLCCLFDLLHMYTLFHIYAKNEYKTSSKIHRIKIICENKTQKKTGVYTEIQQMIL